MVYFYKKSLYWNPKASGYVIGTACGIERKQLLSPTSPPPPHGSVVFNWGVSTFPDWNHMYGADPFWFNYPSHVGISANKVRMQEQFLNSGIPCLEVIDVNNCDPETVVVARTLVSSHSGNGIVIGKACEVPPAKLYTKLENFRIEGRFFVVMSQVVDYVQKKKMGKEKLTAIRLERAHPTIKSHKNGWVFARNNIETNELACELAVDAMVAVELDYGAVDIAWNDPNEPVVIETNSTPGFSNKETIFKFSEALKRYM